MDKNLEKDQIAIKETIDLYGEETHVGRVSFHDFITIAELAHCKSCTPEMRRRAKENLKILCEAIILHIASQDKGYSDEEILAIKTKRKSLDNLSIIEIDWSSFEPIDIKTYKEGADKNKGILWTEEFCSRYNSESFIYHIVGNDWTPSIGIIVDKDKVLFIHKYGPDKNYFTSVKTIEYVKSLETQFDSFYGANHVLNLLAVFSELDFLERKVYSNNFILKAALELDEKEGGLVKALNIEEGLPYEIAVKQAKKMKTVETFEEEEPLFYFWVYTFFVFLKDYMKVINSYEDLRNKISLVQHNGYNDASCVFNGFDRELYNDLSVIIDNKQYTISIRKNHVSIVIAELDENNRDLQKNSKSVILAGSYFDATQEERLNEEERKDILKSAAAAFNENTYQSSEEFAKYKTIRLLNDTSLKDIEEIWQGLYKEVSQLDIDDDTLNDIVGSLDVALINYKSTMDKYFKSKGV